MATASTQDGLSRIPPAETPQSPPMSKPHDPSVALPPVEDHSAPTHPHCRTEAPGASSAHHGRRRVLVVAASIVVLTALAFGVRAYVAARRHEATEVAVDGRLVHVAPQVAGRVLQVLVTDNQPVQAGDLLIQIDPVDFSLKLAQRLAAAQEADGLLEQARWQFVAAEAAQALAEVEIAPARVPGKNRATKHTATQLTVAQLKAAAAMAQVHLARAQVATAEARVAAAEAALTQAGLNLVKTEVRAPRGGRVRTTHVEPGEYVQVGKDLLVLVSEDLGGPANFKADQFTPRPVAVSLEDKAS